MVWLILSSSLMDGLAKNLAGLFKLPGIEEAVALHLEYGLVAKEILGRLLH